MREFRVMQEGAITPDGRFVAGKAVLPGDSIKLSGSAEFGPEMVEGIEGVPGYSVLRAGARGQAVYVCRQHVLEQPLVHDAPAQESTPEEPEEECEEYELPSVAPLDAGGGSLSAAPIPLPQPQLAVKRGRGRPRKAK